MKKKPSLVCIPIKSIFKSLVCSRLPEGKRAILSCGPKPMLKLFHFFPNWPRAAQWTHATRSLRANAHAHNHTRTQIQKRQGSFSFLCRRAAASQLLLHDWGPPERSPSAPPGLAPALLGPRMWFCFSLPPAARLFTPALPLHLRGATAAVSPRAPCKPCSPASA